MQKTSDPFDMPLLSWVNDYVKTLTSTSYIILSILFNLTALFLSVLFTWAMDTFFSDLRQNGAFLGMFRIIEFLAVNIFMKVVTETMEGYPNPIFAFRNHLNAIERIALACSTDKSIAPFLLFLYDACDKKHRAVPLGSLEKMRESRYQLPFDDNMYAKLAKKYSLDERVRVIISGLNSVIKSRNPKVWDDLQYVTQQHQNTDEETTIRDQSYTNQSHVLFLIFWFGGWMIAYIWASTDTKTTIILYPVVSFLLWGVFLQRWWLGSPWNPGRPFVESQHELWTLVYKKRLFAIFDISVPEQ